MGNYKVRVAYVTYADINVYDVANENEAIKYATSESAKFDVEPSTMFSNAKVVKAKVVSRNIRDWREDVW
jgi:hypothetical protein